MNIIDIAAGVLLAEAVLWSVRAFLHYLARRRGQSRLAKGLERARLASTD